MSGTGQTKLRSSPYDPVGEFLVTAYRIYFLDPEGHIFQPPVIIHCATDEEAAEKARQYIDGKDIQVWEQARLIAKYPHK